jgi:hypothetical protein
MLNYQRNNIRFLISIKMEYFNSAKSFLSAHPKYLFVPAAVAGFGLLRTVRHIHKFCSNSIELCKCKVFNQINPGRATLRF